MLSRQRETTLPLAVTVLFLWWMTVMVSASPDPSRYAMLTVDDGLPASDVTSILQDRQGYIWFGTKAGLTRYDGIHMQVYGLGDGLPAIEIEGLFEDKSGRIWILSDGAPCYIEAGQIIVPNIANEDASITGMLHGPDSTIWMLSPRSVTQWSVHSNFEEPGKTVSSDLDWDHPVFIGSYGDTTWLFNRDSLGGMFLRFSGKGKADRFPLLFEPAHPSFLRAVMLDKNRLVYTAKEGLVLFDPFTGQRVLISEQRLGMRTGHAAALCIDNNHRVWMADDVSGMKYVQIQQHLSADSISIAGYPITHNVNARVRHFMQDRERNIWFLTREKGVGFLPGNASFVRNVNSNTGLREDVVLSLASEFNQNIWMGHQDGSIEYLNYTGISGIRPVVGELGSAPVRTLLEAPDGSMLAGSEDGFYQISFAQSLRLGPFTDVRIIRKDDSENVYIGTGNFLYRFRGDELASLSEYESTRDIPSTRIIAAKSITALATGEGADCWYSNSDGLFFYNGFETVDLSRLDNRLAGGISDLHWFDGKLAVATRGNGLLLVEDEKVVQVGITSGLPSNVCSDVFISNDTTLWVATNRGITKLQGQNIASGEFRYVAYDSKDGLITNEVNSIWQMRGILYLGTNSGISIFRESDFRTGDVAPGIYLSNVDIGDADTLLLESYKVPYSKNSLAVRYSGIAFNSGNLIKYQYRLKGYSDEWITTGTDEIRYSSLLPGKYTFEVVAVNKDGLASAEPATFNLRITKPAYQTWWFICLMLLTVASIIYVLYRGMLGHYERKSLKRSVSAKTIELDHKIRELRRSNDELEQFAYIASHDLKEPLRNIANYIQLIRRKYRDQLDDTGVEYMGFAVDGVKRMYEMIDGLLSYSGLVNQDTSVSTVNLNEVVDEVIFDVVHDDGSRRVVINKNNLPTVSAHPRQIRELLNNLIDNGIKFNTSVPPVIGIEGLERDEEFEIRIRDNGIGLDEQFKDKVFQIFEQLDNSFSKPGSGIGLALCKKIVERHGGRIWYTSGAEGSTFHFTLKKHIENQTS